MQENSVQSLGWEDPLEEGMANHPSILVWKIPMDLPGGDSPWGLKESDTTERLSTDINFIILTIFFHTFLFPHANF